MSSYTEIIGTTYNNLTCEQYLGRKAGRALYLWRCVCGGTKESIIGNVRHGGTKKCSNCRTQVSPVHGMSDTAIYRSWRCMRRRCDEPSNNRYRWYGAKGITYTVEWSDFKAFYSDMGASYFEGATLDRIDSSKGYSKSNCQWLTRSENSKKKGAHYAPSKS